MFFLFEQNNTGGFYVEGLPERLFVEASTATEANAIAVANGVDFDDDGCPCCGPRWYTPVPPMNAVALADSIDSATEHGFSYRVVFA